MTGIYFPVQIAVIGILEKDGKYLLQRRKGTSWREGWYSMAGGRVEGKESLKTALTRELREEIGIEVRSEELEFVHLLHISPDVASDEFIYNFFKVKKWKGEPYIAEENKSDDLQWFSKEDFPENMVPIIKETIFKIEKGETYSEYGWQKGEKTRV